MHAPPLPAPPTAKPIQLRVDYRRLNTFFADYARNISRGETFVRTRQPLALGTEFVFVLSLPPATPGTAPLRLELPGIVRWIVEEHEASEARPAGMGISFRFEDPAERERLDDLVRGLLTDALGTSLAERLLPKREATRALPRRPSDLRLGAMNAQSPVSALRLPIAGRAAARPVDPGLDLEDAIAKLKRERNAVVLAHYYQDSDIQDVADFIGDSLQLSQEAQRTTADVICFAGVHFMAETAKILNPTRTVVVPDLTAGCSLADGCPPERLAAWKAKHPDALVVSYINCSAEVKALSDWIVTSSNAEKIVRQLPEGRRVLFAPDKNLGAWLVKKTGRAMDLWPGTCIVHDTFSERKLLGLKERHPGALVLAHPECEDVVLRHADFVGSTTGILKAALASDRDTFIVVTEPGILHQMQKAAPHKTFVAAPPEASCACNECPHMKKNTLEKVYLALRDLEPQLEMSDELVAKARVPMERMLAASAAP